MFLQQPQHNVAEVSGNQRIDGRRIRYRRRHVVKDEIAHIVSLERHVPGQTLKEQDSQRVKVGGSTHILVERAKCFRRCVCGDLHGD